MGLLTVSDKLSGQKPVEKVMKVNERLLMSYLTDLEMLEKALVRLSPRKDNSSEEILQRALSSLVWAQTQLAELLTLEQETCRGGLASEST